MCLILKSQKLSVVLAIVIDQCAPTLTQPTQGIGFGTDDDECTQWSGGVNNEQSDQEEDVPTLEISDVFDSDNDLRS